MLSIFFFFQLYDPTSLVNFDQNSGGKFEIFILIRIPVKNLEDFDQNSGNLMENLKNLDQKSGEKFERFQSEFWW